MGAGETFPAERSAFRDPETGAEVTQLTDYRGHAWHLYFTNFGWYDRDRKLLFASERANHANLFCLDMASGRITQLTDLEQKAPLHFVLTALDPERGRAYFWQGRRLRRLDLATLALADLWEAPAGFEVAIISVTADGRHAATSIREVGPATEKGLQEGYIGFRETFDAHPLSRVVLIATDGSGARVLHEDRCWIGHANASPGRADLMTFCHEGPWDAVDHRIWGLDIPTGRVWKIRPGNPGDVAGHEYWLADGEHVAYHGGIGGKPMFGAVRYDNTDLIEAELPMTSEHFHSLTADLIVGDGEAADPFNLKEAKDYILMWRRRSGRYDGPVRVARHRCSFHIQNVHCHPRLTPDGSGILFCSDRTGYGQLYLVPVPAEAP